MKKLLFAILTAGVLLTGCGSDTKEEMKQFTSESANESAENLYTALSALSTTNFTKLDDTMIENYYGISVSDLSDYVFAQADDPTSAEMIIIVRGNANSDLTVYKENIENVISQKTDEMTNYNEPEQVELLENAKVRVETNAMYVVVGDNADMMAETIENGLGL
ncbi:MAG: DUF4358 domain-containing protein [Lachnospirales bacterium]